MKSSDLLVKQIHEDFDLAQDRLLQIATDFLHKYELNIDKYEKSERLKKLGFSSCSDVKETENDVIQYKKSLEESKLITYYKTEYPFQKFITEDELDRICKKWNLVYAPVNTYIKDIPTKNLIEIENAKVLKEKDIPEYIVKLHLDFFSEVPDKAREWFKNQIFKVKYVPALGSDIFTDKKLRELCPIKWESSWCYTMHSYLEYADKSSLYIAAPETNFDNQELKQMEKTRFGFFRKIVAKPEIKDPIVFRYVLGGIQILSKWGLESSDESLINGIMN